MDGTRFEIRFETGVESLGTDRSIQNGSQNIYIYINIFQIFVQRDSTRDSRVSITSIRSDISLPYIPRGGVGSGSPPFPRRFYFAAESRSRVCRREKRDLVLLGTPSKRTPRHSSPSSIRRVASEWGTGNWMIKKGHRSFARERLFLRRNLSDFTRAIFFPFRSLIFHRSKRNGYEKKK